jgi:threonine/homoserine/homoserine lactone efflux protein
VSTRLLVFVATTWLLAMLPGAGQALMIRQVLEGGPRAARATIAGTATGLLLWSTAAAFGLSAVLRADPRALELVHLGGGAVLLALGVSTLISVYRAGTVARTEDRAGGTGWWSAYGAGLGTNLGNPKAGVFAVSVLPQFAAGVGFAVVPIVTLGAVWALVTACWYLIFAWAVGRGRELASRPAVRRALRITTGVVLIALAVAVGGGA